MMKRRTTTKRKNNRKRRVNRFRLFVVLSLANVALVIVILLMLPTAFQTTDKTTGETKQWLGVESITVEGNTRYDDEAIVGVSGIEEGTSVFSVNTRAAERRIRREFSYAESVKIKIGFKRDVTIRITEAEELGAVYADGKWVVVSNEGVGLMHLPLESERPFRRLYLKGVKTKTDKIGKQVVNDSELSIIRELRTAMDTHGLTGVSEIDLSDRSNIRLNWKNRIIVELGSDTNLSYEIAATVSAIPKILSRHGDTATGILNLSQYSDETVSSPVIVFTPSSILEAEKEQEKAENSTTDPSGDGTDSTSGTGSEDETKPTSTTTTTRSN